MSCLPKTDLEIMQRSQCFIAANGETICNPTFNPTQYILMDKNTMFPTSVPPQRKPIPLTQPTFGLLPQQSTFF